MESSTHTDTHTNGIPELVIRIGSGSIHERIARVQATVRNMPNDKTAKIKSQRTGTEYSYDYMTKGSLENECRQLLSQEGVALYVTEEECKQDGNRCIVTVAIKLACDEGEEVIRRTGYGTDDADKGPAKAGTTAVRLALADLLLQGGGDDYAEHDYVEHRRDVPGQALTAGDRPASAEQLRFANDLVMRAHLDKAMPTPAHSILRLARPIAQGEIAPGLEVPDAIKLIPMAVMTKLIERLEIAAVNPKGAKAVWDAVATWEVEHGLTATVDPPDGVTLDADGKPIPF